MSERYATRPKATAPQTHSHPAMAARGSEVHPSWGSLRFNKASVSPPGAKLVDSDIHHQHVVVMTVSEVSRSRDLHRTWWHEEKEIIEIAMSEAQFAAAITSFGDGSAKPVTIWRREGELIEQCTDPLGSSEIRLAIRETETSAEEAVASLAAEVAKLNKLIEDKAGAKAVREQAGHLTHYVDNLPKNLRFAAQQLQKTVETVVTKARYDIESMVEGRAKALGIPVEEVVLQLGMGDSDE